MENGLDRGTEKEEEREERDGCRKSRRDRGRVSITFFVFVVLKLTESLLILWCWLSCNFSLENASVWTS